MGVVLLVDDEARSLDAMEMALEDICELRRATSAVEALTLIEREPVDLVLTDQRMPGMTGVELLSRVRISHPGIARMIVTGYTDPADMIAAINDAGIDRFIQKPWHPDALVSAVTAAIAVPATQADPFATIVCAPGGAMASVVAQARVLARHDLPCLLVGETGSGRNALARAMAAASGRGAMQSVSALSDSAVAALRAQDGGTLFIRDLDQAPPARQAEIADAMTSRAQDGAAPSAPRIIAAIRPGIEAGLLADLRYRLSACPLYLPALRDRRADLPALAQAVLDRAAQTHGIASPGFAPGGLERLSQGWTGNLRDLENAVIRALLFADGQPLELASTPNAAPDDNACADRGADAEERLAADDLDAAAPGTLRDRVAALETAMIRAALDRAKGNKSHAARELGLSRVGLRAKLDRYGMDKED